jgi:uncharacterized protein
MISLVRVSSRASRGTRSDIATVVTSQKVRAGREDEYRRWQDRVNETARGFEGFVGTEQYSPSATGENEWVVVFRFSHLGQLTAWLDSGVRGELIEQGRAVFGNPRPKRYSSAVLRSTTP